MCVVLSALHDSFYIHYLTVLSLADKIGNFVVSLKGVHITQGCAL